MIAAFDVYYDSTPAKGVVILFDWDDEKPRHVFDMDFDGVEEYVPGQFYKRELPCILTLFEKIKHLQPEILLVDGHVWTGNEHQKGLGAHLFDALEKKYPVIGVAKSNFKEVEKVCTPVLRGESKNPLWVSSVGIPVEFAADKVKNMPGEFRMPAVLKMLDGLTRPT